MPSTQNRPSRAVVVTAVVALLLGAFGSRGAADAAALSKASVKKIATKVVTKAAPSLSVAHASTADSATTAGNATNLNGQPAAVYLDRVAYATNLSSVALPPASNTEVLAPLPITVPAGVGFLTAFGTASIIGDAPASAWVAIDTTCADQATTAYMNRSFVDPGTGETPISFNFASAVTAGLHTVRLCARNGVAGNARGINLTVQTVATGHLGTSQLRPSATPGADGDPDAPQ